MIRLPFWCLEVLCVFFILFNIGFKLFSLISKQYHTMHAIYFLSFSISGDSGLIKYVQPISACIEIQRPDNQQEL